MTTELLRHRQHSNVVTAIALTAFVFVLALFAQLRVGPEASTAGTACAVDAAMVCATTSDESSPRSRLPSFATTFIH